MADVPSAVTGLFNTALLPAHPRASLAERVAIILKRFIVAEGLAAGARLPAERQLADTFNVSRTVLREAISRLLGEGILVRQSPRVLVVAEFDRASALAALQPIDEQESAFHDLMELRMFIEIGAIEVIAARITPPQLKAIERWVIEGERRFHSGEPIHLADAHFHTELLRVLGNSAIDSLLPMVEEQIRTLLLFDPQQIADTGGASYQRVVREHRAIYEALIARDGAKARRIMTEHLGYYAKMPRIAR